MPTEAKHQPLPYIYDERGGCVAVYSAPPRNCLSGANKSAIYYKHGELILGDDGHQDWYVDGVDLATGRFLARACNSHYELLEALVNMVRFYGPGSAGQAKPGQFYTAAKAAIAKATEPR